MNRNKILTTFLAFIITLIGLNTWASYFPKTTLTGYDANSPAIDAFDRQRVSDVHTLFDSKQIIGKDVNLYWDEVTNLLGNCQYTNADASVYMSVSSNTDFAIRQTRQRMSYQPGKSQEILITFNTSNATGAQSRVGYYNTGVASPYTSNVDGIFFQMENGTASVNIAKSGITTSVVQSAWNLDKMDGTGSSGITLDFTKTQIFFIDFEWLGVGRVRCGWVVDGVIIYCHQFLHANNKTSVYMSSPNHSVRYSIRSTGGSGWLQQICSSVMSEGDFEFTGVSRGWEATNTYSIATGDKNVMVMALRLQTNAVTSDIQIKNIVLTAPSLGAEAVKIELVANPLYGATLDWVNMPNSSLQIATAANAITTGGTVIAVFYMAGGVDQTSEFPESRTHLGMSINGTLDVWVIRVSSISANGDAVSTSVNWQEMQ